MASECVSECCFSFMECATMHNALFHIKITADSMQTSQTTLNENRAPLFFRAKQCLFQCHLHYLLCTASNILSHIYFPNISLVS